MRSLSAVSWIAQWLWAAVLGVFPQGRGRTGGLVSGNLTCPPLGLRVGVGSPPR